MSINMMTVSDPFSYAARCLRSRWGAVPVCMALLAIPATPQAVTPHAGVGEPIARLRVELPRYAKSFLLRGTVPVPKATHLSGAWLPLKIVDYDGTVISDTQMEAVTRYPNAASEGADVVELIARVGVATAWNVGELREYSVVLDPSGTTPDPGTPGLEDLRNGTAGTLELQGVPATVEELLSEWWHVAVVTTDPLGKRYYSFPMRGAGSMKTVRYGRYMSTLRTYETQLQRTTPLPGEYPHMFGVHAYLSTQSGEEHLMMDLRFNNGADRHDNGTTVDDILGKAYFQKIELYVSAELSEQWHPQQQFLDPFGLDHENDVPDMTTFLQHDYLIFPLVKPLPEGKMHMAPCRAQFHRRLILATLGEREQNMAREALEGRGQGFSRKGRNVLGVEYWSWWNAETARYFPQNRRLPDLSYSQAGVGDGMQGIRARITQLYEARRSQLLNDTPFSDGPPSTEGCQGSRQLGWARPLYHPDGAMAGGTGIVFLYGVQGANAGHLDSYRWLQINHRLNTERQPNVLYSGDGAPTSQGRWLEAAPGNCCFNPSDPTDPSAGPRRTRLDFWFNHGVTPGSPTAQFFCIPGITWSQNAFVANAGLQPSYESSACSTENLGKWRFHEDSHLVRYLNPAMALCWLGNDPIARDDVLMQAELYRMSFTEYPRGNCDGHNLTLFRRLGAVLQECPGSCPSWGTAMTRSHGWGLTVVSAAHAMQDDAWRHRMSSWYAHVLELAEKGIQTGVDTQWSDPLTGLPYEWGVLNIINPDWTATCHVSSSDCEGPCTCAWTQYRSRMVWHEMIIQNGLRGAAESVFVEGATEHSRMLAVLRKSLLGNAAPVTWDPACRAVAYGMPVSGLNCGDPLFVCPPGECDPGDQTLPPNCHARGKSSFYAHTLLADGFQLIGDQIFLLRHENSMGGSATTSTPLHLVIEAIVSEIEASDPMGGPGGFDRWQWLNASVMLGLLQ